MKILGIIPARYNSTRFPGKPLASIQGKSMIQRVYEQTALAKSFSKIIVATDDIRILEHVEGFGGNVIMTSDKHVSGTDRCGEVINTISEEFDLVINIQGDEPFIHPEQLEKLILACKNNTIQIATLAKKIVTQDDIINTNIVKVVFGVDNTALYFSRSVIPFHRNTETKTDYYKHIGLYAYRTDILQKIIQLPQSKLEIAESLEQLRWLENNYSIHIVETNLETISIDTPQDIELL